MEVWSLSGARARSGLRSGRCREPGQSQDVGLVVVEEPGQGQDGRLFVVGSQGKVRLEVWSLSGARASQELRSSRCREPGQGQDGGQQLLYCYPERIGSRATSP